MTMDALLVELGLNAMAAIRQSVVLKVGGDFAAGVKQALDDFRRTDKRHLLMADDLVITIRNA